VIAMDVGVALVGFLLAPRLRHRPAAVGATPEVEPDRAPEAAA